jgi:hypothetical protein
VNEILANVWAEERKLDSLTDIEFFDEVETPKFESDISYPHFRETHGQTLDKTTMVRIFRSRLIPATTPPDLSLPKC